ncbi:MAG TPA: hypothetical protein VFB06_12820 [Streptosporangiaceae bacterium]|nr:hypothetical protein [Streptosporangiaceae bacterium]
MYRSYRFRKRFKICLAAIAGVLVLTGTMLIISVLTQGPQPPGTTEPPPVPDLFGSGSPPASQAAAGPMRVLQGRELVNGVRLGYPHTAQGAISAADEFARDIGSALDPDTAAAILRLTADPSYSQGPQRYAQGVVTTREVLGLPASGPVPDGASAVLQPVEYQLKYLAADQVTVLFLTDLDVTLPGQGTQAKVSLFPLRMHWARGDWKILLPRPAGDFSSLLTEPDTSQAAAAGWKELSP